MYSRDLGMWRAINEKETAKTSEKIIGEMLMTGRHAKASDGARSIRARSATSIIPADQAAVARWGYDGPITCEADAAEPLSHLL